MMDRSRSSLNIIQDLKRQLEALESGQTILANRTLATDWIYVGTPGAPIFVNSWLNYPGTYPDVGFRRDSDGFVHVKGLAYAPNPMVAGMMFVLPVGFRPADYIVGHAFVADVSVGRIDIHPDDGQVYVSSIYSNTYWDLSPLNWQAVV